MAEISFYYFFILIIFNTNTRMKDDQFAKSDNPYNFSYIISDSNNQFITIINCSNIIYFIVLHSKIHIYNTQVFLISEQSSNIYMLKNIKITG